MPPSAWLNFGLQLAGETFHSPLEPNLAVVEVLAGEAVESAKKRPANAARHAMINVDYRFIDDLTASVGGHGDLRG
jgi:hypothetical protein